MKWFCMKFLKIFFKFLFSYLTKSNISPQCNNFTNIDFITIFSSFVLNHVEHLSLFFSQIKNILKFFELIYCPINLIEKAKRNGFFLWLFDQHTSARFRRCSLNWDPIKILKKVAMAIGRDSHDWEFFC